MKKTRLTETEKAAIFYGIFNRLPDSDIYLICHGCKPENAPKVCNQWKKLDHVKIFWDQAEQLYKKYSQAVREEEKRQKAGEIEPASLAIDFTNKAEFIQYLNESANRIQDDKLKNDVLKMLSDHLDFKDESKRGENAEIQRFYLPLRCQDCKIYQAASQEGGTGITL